MGRIAGFAIAALRNHSIWALVVHSDFYRSVGWRDFGLISRSGEVKLRWHKKKPYEQEARKSMQAPYLLYRQTISSELGEFELRIESTNRPMHSESSDSSIKLTSTGSQIVIKRLAAPIEWLPPHMQVDRAEAWLFYITKLGAEMEQLNLSFCLVSNHSKVDAGADTGQGLVAIEFEDGVRQIHIGTQDEETFYWYSQQAWVPKRISQELANDSLLITNIASYGLKTQIPDLLENEQFYLHYVWAESLRRKSADYPKEQDVSTWFAVNQTKETLEKAWKYLALNE